MNNKKVPSEESRIAYKRLVNALKKEFGENWKIVFEGSKLLAVEQLPMNSEPKHCICGHVLKKHAYHMETKLGVRYILGSECIKRYYENSDFQFTEIMEDERRIRWLNNLSAAIYSIYSYKKLKKKRLRTKPIIDLLEKRIKVTEAHSYDNIIEPFIELLHDKTNRDELSKTVRESEIFKPIWELILNEYKTEKEKVFQKHLLRSYSDYEMELAEK